MQVLRGTRRRISGQQIAQFRPPLQPITETTGSQVRICRPTLPSPALVALLHPAGAGTGCCRLASGLRPPQTSWTGQGSRGADVCTVVAAARTEHEFFELSRQEGVLVRLRGSTKNPGLLGRAGGRHEPRGVARARR
jgi:hypothetical protein